MSDIAIEMKGSFPYDDDRHRGGNRGRNAPALVAHTYTHAVPSEKKTIANTAALGFFANAVTIFIFSLYSLQARGITISNAGVGMACFFGGLCQLIAGIWSFPTGNTFAATAFTTYGGWWLGYSAFFFPGLGISDAYTGHSGELSNATGVILAGWTILTLVFLLGTLRINLVVFTFFFLLEMNFLLHTITEFTGSLTLQKVVGGEGIVLSLVAFYAAAANLLTEEISLFTLPVGNLSRH